MSAWWDEDRKLLLITAEEFEALPDGEVLTCIDDTTAIKGVDEIDDDTRGGHMAYGVVGNHPLRVAHLEACLAAPKKPEPSPIEHKAWSCKIGIRGQVSGRLSMTPSTSPNRDREEGWRPIETAPHACHVLACRFDDCEWVYAVVLSPPCYPFTHWRPLPAPPAPQRRQPPL